MPARARFSRETQRQALVRQKNCSACCGTDIAAVGEAGRSRHAYGEAAHAHHIQHAKHGGSNELANCVVILEACHYSVHEGGSYRFGAIDGCADDFPHFNS